ncbi:MAG: hydroxymethylbilane synthase, partial [Thermoleophilaceae bacterium]|nr:hydroxymethylbilane synthase [Thermoleophilaceae bacterium]
MKLRVGTRGSKLARTQTAMVCGLLSTSDPSIEYEQIVITTDDTAVGDKSRFVSALEVALLADEIDVAVHSAKDLPGAMTDGLTIGAVPQRAPAFDLLCGQATLAELPAGASVGTSSLRRKAQLLSLRPELSVNELRGNIDTRLAKLAAGEYDAIILAQAGMRRLGVNDVQASVLEQCVPAPGQGCLALQIRNDDMRTRAAVSAVSDAQAELELIAERAAMVALGADCETPLGVHASETSGELVVEGWAGLPDGSVWIRDSVRGQSIRAAQLGAELAE